MIIYGMISNYIVILSYSLILGVIGIPLLKKLSERFRFLRGKGIPLVGGIGMWFSFFLIATYSFEIHKYMPKGAVGILAASTIMFAFGLIDDLWELSVGYKFLVQAISASVLILFGVRIQIIYLPDYIDIIITFLWIIGITNAFNHLDVLDGLAGLAALIIVSAFFTVSFINGDIQSIVLTISLLGAIVGFLVYNLPPAKVYMGNSGSHFLGFLLAAVAITISYASIKRPVALVSPILILGLPIFDTGLLIILRSLKNISPFNKSTDHLALQLLAEGYSKVKVLYLMISLCLFFCFCGILITRLPNFFGIAVVLCAIFVSFSIAKKIKFLGQKPKVSLTKYLSGHNSSSP